MSFTVNARETMSGLFMSDPVSLSEEDCVKIFEHPINNVNRS